jgi:hypothetical protein
VGHRRCTTKREGYRPLGFERSRSKKKTLALITMLERGVLSNIGLLYIEVLVYIYIYIYI